MFASSNELLKSLWLELSKRFKSSKDCFDAHDSSKNPKTGNSDEENPVDESPSEKKPFLKGTRIDCYFIVAPEESCLGTQAWCTTDEWRKLDGYSSTEDCIEVHEPKDSLEQPTTLEQIPPATKEQDISDTATGKFSRELKSPT